MDILEIYRATPLLRERMLEIISGAGQFINSIDDALMRTSPTGEAAWHYHTFAILLIAMCGAALIVWFLNIWTKHYIQLSFDETPESRRAKIGFLVVRWLVMSVHALVFSFSCFAIAMAINGDVSASRLTYLSFITSFGIIGLMRAMLMNFFAPDLKSHRMFRLENADAMALYFWFLAATVAAALVAAICYWMSTFQLSHDAHMLLLVFGSLGLTLIFSVLFVLQRQSIAGLIAGKGENGFRTTFAQSWHVLAVGYVLVTWFVASARIVLGMQLAFGLIVGPMLVVVIAISVYGLMLYVIDAILEKFVKVGEMGSAHAIEDQPYRKLIERGASMFALTFGLFMFFGLWGMNLMDRDGFFYQCADIIIILFIAYLLFEAVNIAIARKIEREGGFVELCQNGDEGGISNLQASRLVTLLPLVRNFILAAIFILTVMVLLSRLGVDVAPLFAGAGVIGIAIGFGAQALIKDIFSGAFFLLDDAFRQGEYVDTGEVKGMVEKISLRSVQLRHHLGALHTIPFGEIKQMSNLSRDWAVLNVSIRVKSETDLSKVSNIIETLSDKLMKEPEVGDKFLAPLKLQGIKEIDESALILSAKFMTRPGDQFEIQRLIHDKIRTMFVREGIGLASRELTIRLSNDEGVGASVLNTALKV